MATKQVRKRPRGSRRAVLFLASVVAAFCTWGYVHALTSFSTAKTTKQHKDDEHRAAAVDECAAAAAVGLRNRPALPACPLGDLRQLIAVPAPRIDCAAYGLKRRAHAATVIDAVLLSSEADILTLRLLELDSVVDTFVILESRVSHSGQQRPVLWDTHEGCFQRWSRRIVHRAIDQINASSHGSWDRENWHRNYLSVLGSEAVADRCQPHARQPSQDDVLFAVSDVDELPRAENYAVLKQCEGFEWPVAPIQDRFLYYSFNWRKQMNWTFGPGIIPWGRRETLPPQWTRAMPKRSSDAAFQRGGWHMSYFMPVDKIIEKLSYYAHTDLNHPPFNEPGWISECLKTGRDLYGRSGGEELEFNNCSAPDADVPEAFKLNPHFFAHFCPLSG
jgi:beta-1,4-mannosyl-glycoprotein beta-1,4-N-acetylglucosaminyltransferase